MIPVRKYLEAMKTSIYHKHWFWKTLKAQEVLGIMCKAATLEEQLPSISVISLCYTLRQTLLFLTVKIKNIGHSLRSVFSQYYEHLHVLFCSSLERILCLNYSHQQPPVIYLWYPPPQLFRVDLDIEIVRYLCVKPKATCPIPVFLSLPSWRHWHWPWHRDQA